MARYKPVEYAQGQFISISFEKQILPGSFEHAVNFVVGEKLDFSALDKIRTNDDSGAPAYDPRVMLKIVLCAYARGIFSSRDIAAECQENVVMMSLSANTRPHFTTIAQFVRDLGPAMQDLFVDVLLYCDELNLIGKDMFAIDGCKFSSNASKEWSGTRAEFAKKRDKYRASVEKLVSLHRAMDKNGLPEAVPGKRAQEEKAIKSFRAKTAKIDAWLRENPKDKIGSGGKPVKSSMTDADSAKMASSRGVIQGYNGLAMVDSKHQVIVGAEAFGKADEAAVFEPMLEQVRETFKKLKEKNIYRKAKVCGDSGFHTEASMKMLAEKKIDGYVPDKLFRKRDSTFETAGEHRSFKALIGRNGYKKRFFSADEFILDPEKGKLVCPAGKELYVKDRNFKTANGYHGTQYMAKKTDCRVCELRTACLRKPHSPARTVFKVEGRWEQETFSKRMIKKLESEVGRFLYGMRMGIVEPVFANLRHMMGLDRFTLRGKAKVNIQWLLFSVVHNIHKAQRFGLAGAG
jgi:transposase